MVSPGQKYARIPQAGNPAKTEAWALLESARQMESAKKEGPAVLGDVLRRNWRLWTLFQANLVSAECTLPNEVRGNLLGLANFIDRHTAGLLVKPEPAQLDVLININRQIGEGLLEGQRNANAKVAASSSAPPTHLRESA